jgi:hypothetical protein
MLHLNYRSPALCLLAALLAQALPAGAGVVVYTDRASFLAAMPNVATDTFNDLAGGAVLAGPLARGLGSAAYRATVADTAGLGGADQALDFYPLSTGPNNVALSNNYAPNALLFDQFAPQARGIGASFYSSGEGGDFLPGQALAFTFMAADGMSSWLLHPTSADSFLGFIADGPIVSLSVRAVQGGPLNWVALDDLAISAVPEPSSALLFGAGLCGLGLLGAARQRPR